MLHYKPLQPTIKPPENHVKYNEVFPGLPLQPFIHCYWELKTIQKLNQQFNYRVVADACIDVFFELDQPAESFVMGFCRQYTEFPLDHEFHYVGIRFLPSMFSQLTRIDSSQLSNRSERVDSVIPSLAHFISSRCNENLALSEIKEILDEYFIRLLTKCQIDFDKRFYGALELILKTQGRLNVEKDIDTGLSSRQLRRLFNFYIGDSAKTFCKVVRFQNILRSKPSSQSLKENKLFFDAGFYDQAHFIKDFKNFYGTTPTQALGR